MVRPANDGCAPVSKDAKPKKPEAEAAEPEGEVEGEETAKKKGLGLIPMVAAAVVAAGVAGGAAFVLAPGGGSDAAHCVTADDAGHGAEDSHGAAGDEHSSANEHHGAGVNGDASAPCVEIAADEKDTDKKEESGHGKKESKKKKSSGGHGGGDSAESAVKPIGEVQHTDYATFLVLEPMIISIQPIGRSKHLKVSLVLETDDDGAESMLEHGFYIQDVLNTYLRSVDATVLEDPASMSRLRAQMLRRIRAIIPDAEISNVLITEFILT